MNENQNEISQDKRKELEQVAMDQFIAAVRSKNWVIAAFHVDENNKIRHGMTMCEFKHADFPAILGQFKQWLDREFYKMPRPEPLPLADFVNDGVQEITQGGENEKAD